MSDPERLVREWFERARASGDARLPAERMLAAQLGLSRAALRKGLAALDGEGLLVREVGRGTFLKETGRVAAEPEAALLPPADLLRQAAPRDVLVARWLVEPPMARLAASEASAHHVDRLRAAASHLNDARDRRAYERGDEAFHRAIAEATRNPVMVQVFDSLVRARQAIAWGRLAERPPFDEGLAQATDREHEEIVDAIASRDLERAETSLRAHLQADIVSLVVIG